MSPSGRAEDLPGVRVLWTGPAPCPRHQRQQGHALIGDVTEEARRARHDRRPQHAQPGTSLRARPQPHCGVVRGRQFFKQ